jgi:hypothetical protein
VRFTDAVAIHEIFEGYEKRVFQHNSRGAHLHGDSPDGRWGSGVGLGEWQVSAIEKYLVLCSHAQYNNRTSTAQLEGKTLFNQIIKASTVHLQSM